MLKDTIIEKIKYSNNWNDKCPEWVIKVIENVPEEHTELIVDYLVDGMKMYAVHGVLVRCRDCMHYDNGRCKRFLCGVYVDRNHYCGWGKKNED